MRIFSKLRLKLILALLLLFFCYSIEVFADESNRPVEESADLMIAVEGYLLDVPAGVILRYTGSIQGAGPLIKTGGGELILHVAEIGIPALIVTDGTVEADGRLLAKAAYIAVTGDGTPGSAVLRIKGEVETATLADFVVVDISNGGRLEAPNEGGFVLGGQAGSYGVVNVKGEGSALVCAGPLQVGREGYGAVNLSDGGVLNFPNTNDPDQEVNAYWGSENGGYGLLTITGPGSGLYVDDAAVKLHFDYYGSGELRIRDGGQLRTRGSLFMGYGDGSRAVGYLNGKDSLLLCNGLGLGGAETAAAKLSVTDGGCLISSSDITINGQADNTSISVAGTESLLYCGSEMRIGDGYFGALHLYDGGQAAVDFSVIIGSNDNEDGYGVGYLYLTGPGTRLYCDNNFYISSTETAEMHIANGAELQVLVSQDISRYEGESAEVHVWDGGRILANYISVGCDGRGLLSISNGSEVKVNRGLQYNKDDIEDDTEAGIKLSGNSQFFVSEFRGCGENFKGVIVDIDDERFEGVAYEAFEEEMNAAMQWDRNLTETFVKPLLEW